MKDVMSVMRLIPCLLLAIAWMPATWSVAVAQQAPDLKEAQGTNVIEVVKGSLVDRVVVRSDDPYAAVDRRSAAGADELTRKIEVFKGGEIVVLTVVDSDRSKPVAARIDAFKSHRSGPTYLLPVRLRDAGPAPQSGPTHLLPARLRAAGTAQSSGPTNLHPVQPRGATPAPGSANPVPSPSPVAGAAFRDLAVGNGVLAASVEKGSPAWQDGLQRADVIESVYCTPVRDLAGLEARLASAGGTAVLQVRRGDDNVVVVLHR